jgi:hypothetical protein
MPAIHIASFPDTEILRHQEELPCQQQGDYAENNIKGPPDMTLHEIPPPSPKKYVFARLNAGRLQPSNNNERYLEFISFVGNYNLNLKLECCR